MAFLFKFIGFKIKKGKMIIIIIIIIIVIIVLKIVAKKKKKIKNNLSINYVKLINIFLFNFLTASLKKKNN